MTRTLDRSVATPTLSRATRRGRALSLRRRDPYSRRRPGGSGLVGILPPVLDQPAVVQAMQRPVEGARGGQPAHLPISDPLCEGEPVDARSAGVTACGEDRLPTEAEIRADDVAWDTIIRSLKTGQVLVRPDAETMRVGDPVSPRFPTPGTSDLSSESRRLCRVHRIDRRVRTRADPTRPRDVRRARLQRCGSSTSQNCRYASVRPGQGANRRAVESGDDLRSIEGTRRLASRCG